jgi:uracil-DNA glycosylase
MVSDTIQLEESWKRLLADQFEQPYMRQLAEFLRAEKKRGKLIFPPGEQIFSALNSTPFHRVRVVVLGQDPYHGPGQAHGLCFSVMPGVAIPPSLVNIYREIEQDLGIVPANHGCLINWARQGVLLLNAVLTVEKGQAGSHHGKGWEEFTDQIVDHLNRDRTGLVYMLWGSNAQRKGRLIDRSRHLVLESPHPSPLSAHRGFYGGRHFSRANDYLARQQLPPIDWQLPKQVDF